MSREVRSHASSTVNRDQDGSIRYVVVRSEVYYEDTDAHENDPDRYTDGVSAKFRFNFAGGVADLVAVKDIEDGAEAGYESSLNFLRTIPVAEDAVTNVPGVEEVGSTEARIMDLLDKGRTAARKAE